MKPIPIIAVTCGALLLAASARGDLSVGDPAPKLAQGKYVQGEPVKEFEKGKVYVIEMWATWCGPCIAAIPHVNDLQKKYADKGLVVIGQNIWEHDESEVEPFVKKQGEKMTYRVAMDDKNGSEKGKMADTWMAAAGENGIPCSFIVNQEGKVAWIGHPMSMDKPLAEVLEGKFDLEKSKADHAKKQAAGKAMQQLQALVQGRKWDEALAKIDEIAKADPTQAATMASYRLHVLSQAGKWDQVLAALDEMDKKNPAQAKRTLGMRYQALVETKQTDKAKAVADQALKDAATDPLPAIMIANAALNAKDYDLAVKLSEAAAAHGNDNAAQAYMTLARAHAAREDWAKAVEAQKKAIDAAPNDRMKQFLQNQLKQYENKAAAKKAA